MYSNFWFISSHPLDESGIYTIKTQAVDNGFVGEAAFVYNITIESHPSIQTINESSHSNNVTVPKNRTVEIVQKDSELPSDRAAIAGGATGAVTLLGLGIFIFIFLLRRRRKRRLSQSIKVRFTGHFLIVTMRHFPTVHFKS